MSYHQLQRVVVRMLYDPAFVAQIFADPATALRDEDLTDQERAGSWRWTGAPMPLTRSGVPAL